MWAILQKALLWLLDVAQIKFVISVIITAVVAFLYNNVLSLIQPFLNSSAIYSAFASINPSVWYFIDLANIGVGVPLIFGALSVRFVVRRLPFVG